LTMGLKKSERVMIDCCVWRGEEEMAYPDGRQDHQPFLKEWIRMGKNTDLALKNPGIPLPFRSA